MSPFLITCCIILLLNLIFMAVAIVFTFYYKKQELLEPRQAPMKELTQPRHSLQPQIIIYETVRRMSQSHRRSSQASAKPTNFWQKAVKQINSKQHKEAAPETPNPEQNKE